MLNKSLLVLIILLGAFLRFSNINNSPPSLNWDEAALGYNAYSILLTGRDEYGVTRPLFTRSFDDYKSMLPVYPMALSVKLFGLNEFAVRAPTALWGILTIVLLYLLVRATFSGRIAFFVAFFFAIEPWAVHLSRVYHEATMALFFYIAMLYLFVLSKKHGYLLIPGLLCGIISMFTYHTNKLLVPLTISVLFLTYFKEFLQLPKKIKLICLTILLIGFSLFAHQVIFANALARIEATTIFRIFSESDRQGIAQVTYFIQQWAGRYLLYFSPSNLFLREPREPATVIPGNSMFFPFEFIFWIVGMFLVLRKAKKNKSLIQLMLLAPLPASFTWNWFQPGRTLSLFAIYSLFVGLGMDYFWGKINGMKKLVVAVFIIGLTTMSVFFLFDSVNYQISAKLYGSWQPGFREAMPVVAEKEDDYKLIIIDTPHAQPYIFTLFYSAYSPNQYLSELDLDKIGTPRKAYDFGKYIFRKLDFAQEKKQKDALYVLWKGSQAFGQFSDEELIFKNEIPNVDGDTIVQIVAFK